MWQVLCALMIGMAFGVVVNTILPQTAWTIVLTGMFALIVAIGAFTLDERT
jgi:hypothetical protein